MPKRDDVGEDEGFGFFRDTWWIGHVTVAEAESIVREEAELIGWLDHLARTPEEFEILASAIEDQQVDHLPHSLHAVAAGRGLQRYVVEGQPSPLDGLEVGVAGLAHAMSAMRCLTAASCRWHMHDRSWSDCPVVFFAALPWRVEVLAELVSEEGCGLDLDADRS